MAAAELGDLSDYKARVAEIESSNNPLEVTRQEGPVPIRPAGDGKVRHY